jgi:hypothetical protein
LRSPDGFARCARPLLSSLADTRTATPSSASTNKCRTHLCCAPVRGFNGAAMEDDAPLSHRSGWVILWARALPCVRDDLRQPLMCRAPSRVSGAMSDRVKLAREIAARTEPRFIDIKPERRSKRAAPTTATSSTFCASAAAAECPSPRSS